jgi:hypothetical protein
MSLTIFIYSKEGSLNGPNKIKFNRFLKYDLIEIVFV